MDNSAVPGQTPPLQTPQPAPVLPQSSNTVSAGPKKGRSSKVMLLGLVGLLVAAGLLAGGYVFGKSQVKDRPAMQITPSSKVSEVTVPQGATIIAQCVEGRGTQYILPKDIPEGPIYNVHEGKVIGIEYMVPKTDLANAATKMVMLDLFKKQYDHVMIGDVPHGHAGNSEDHYHFDFMMVPDSESDMIKCGTSTDTSHSHTGM